MTSEVLILNRRAAIVAADSAITSSRAGSQPRYSKSATKIFDLSKRGRVAAAFFGNAALDIVPWEVAIKQFRAELGDETFARCGEYLDALLAYLSGNSTFFPSDVLEGFIAPQFDDALLQVVKYCRNEEPIVFDTAQPLEKREALWRVAAEKARQAIIGSGITPSLSTDEMDKAIADHRWIDRAKEQLNAVADLDAVDASELAELAHKLRYFRPDLTLSKSGLVVVGYGEDEIFPGFKQAEVYGHVGNELAYKFVSTFQVTHANGAMIQPLARTSMIDMFTDGFGQSLQSIIEQASKKALATVVTGLAEQGAQIPEGISEGIVAASHDAFMLEWRRENWDKNFTPLISVMGQLDVQEMAHLAETLLVLESLKERVTSPSEEVGGPIDVAAITKAEGLVWIKRKHYFDSQINMRYAARLRQAYEP